MTEGTNIKDDGSTRDGSTPVPWHPTERLDPERDFITIDGERYAIARLLLPAYRNKQANGSADAISTQQWANARRIVASVNAMADLPIGILERMAEQKLAALKATEGPVAHG